MSSPSSRCTRAVIGLLAFSLAGCSLNPKGSHPDKRPALDSALDSDPTADSPSDDTDLPDLTDPADLRDLPDLDNDGWSAPVDCDDSNPAIHPGVDETCDGLDQDCDGVIDDNPIAGRPYYADRDGDGYGNWYESIQACSASEGWIGNSGDCDDTDASIHPGAKDIVGDGENTDCNNDWDDDGYEGHLPYADGPDCDDSDPGIHPGVTDAWGDSIDSDCDGFANPPRSLTEADGVFHGEDPQGYAGVSAIVTGDLDGDGLRELALGAPGVGDTPGTVWLLSPDPSAPLDPYSRVEGDDRYTLFGLSVAGIADVNLDGQDDLVVMGASPWGIVFLLHGPITSDRLASSAETRILPSGRIELGWAIDASHDLSGDDLADLVVSAPYASGTSTYTGAVYVFTGPLPDGDLDLLSASATLFGVASVAKLGTSLAAGDLDGDGVGDLVASAPGDPWLHVYSGPILGSASHSGTLGAGSDTTGAEIGASMAGGQDLNGDGLDDVLIGSPVGMDIFPWLGRASLVLGPVSDTSSLDEAEATLISLQEDDFGGHSVSFPGDVDGDGHGDILVGAPGKDAGIEYDEESGAACLFFGPVSGTVELSQADIAFVPGEPDQYTGYDLDGGDIDGDGLSDLLISAPCNSTGADHGGAAWLMLASGL